MRYKNRDTITSINSHPSSQNKSLNKRPRLYNKLPSPFNSTHNKNGMAPHREEQIAPANANNNDNHHADIIGIRDHRTPNRDSNSGNRRRHMEQLMQNLQNLALNENNEHQTENDQQQESGYQEYLEEVFESSRTNSTPFDPPLYQQRYTWVTDCIEKMLGQEESISVAELGFASFKSFLKLKRIPNITKVVGVDKCLDELDLENVEPFPGEFIIPREKRLEVSIYQGDLILLDDRLKNLDFISMIEVVEHIEMDELKCIMNTIANVYRPRYLAITTPNSEFNKYFGSENRFRHHDHKFEFTRSEFEQWCLHLAEVYEYSCEFAGVGYIEGFSEQNGYCTQCALFTNKLPLQNIEAPLDTNFQLIYTINYPHESMEQREEKRRKAFNREIITQAEFFAEKFISETEDELMMPEGTEYTSTCAYCIPMDLLEQELTSKLGNELTEITDNVTRHIKENDLLKLSDDSKFFIYRMPDQNSEEEYQTHESEVKSHESSLIDNDGLMSWN